MRSHLFTVPTQRPPGYTVRIGKSHVCSGFRLSVNKVVTTARCVDGQDTGQLEVQYGGTERGKLPFKSTVSKISINRFNSRLRRSASRWKHDRFHIIRYCHAHPTVLTAGARRS